MGLCVAEKYCICSVGNKHLSMNEASNDSLFILKMKVKVQPTASSSEITRRANFLQHLKPLTVWMKLLGIDLDPNKEANQENKTCKGWFVIGFGIILFILNITSQMFLVARIVLRQNPANQTFISTHKKENSTHLNWNFIIEYSSIGLVTFGCHATLIFHSRFGKQWKLLWNDLKQLTEDSKKSLNFYRISIMALVYIFLVRHYANIKSIFLYIIQFQL